MFGLMVSNTQLMRSCEMTLKRLICVAHIPSHNHLYQNGIRLIIMLVLLICLIMDTLLKIITFGLYGLFAKKRSLKQKTEKTKYRQDGTIKKQVNRETDYAEEESPTPEEL